MPTNEERREVAARLRGIVEKTWYTSWHELYTIKNACGCYDEQDSQDMVLKDRLADLIEPEPERTCSDIAEGMRFECSECGCTVRLTCDDYPTITAYCLALVPNYCPNCGAKVVDE